MTSNPVPLTKQSSSDFILVQTPQPDSPTSKAAPPALHSNNEHKNEFVMVHESPGTKRRQLRASKEISDEDRAEMSRRLVLGTGVNFEGDDEISPPVVPELQRTMSMPISLQRKGSYKNGRRLSASAEHKENDDDEVSPPVAPEPPAVLSRANSMPSPQRRASYKNGRRLSAEAPESPTSVAVDHHASFFGGLLGGSASKLLGKALTSTAPLPSRQVL